MVVESAFEGYWHFAVEYAARSSISLPSRIDATVYFFPFFGRVVISCLRYMKEFKILNGVSLILTSSSPSNCLLNMTWVFFRFISIPIALLSLFSYSNIF